MDSQYTLIVNGQPKPWPIDNYYDNQVTIDLNWGIDTDYYQAEIVTFSVRELEKGKTISHVRIDKEKREIICEIPIIEKERHYHLCVDWEPVKAEVEKNLTIVVDGHEQEWNGGELTLKGEEQEAEIYILFNGVKCKTQKGENDNIIVILPETASNSNTVTRPISISVIKRLLPGFFIGVFLVVFIWVISVVSRETPYDYLEDNIVWQRKEMKEGMLSAVYDAVNNYDAEKLDWLMQLDDDLKQPCLLELSRLLHEAKSNGVVWSISYSRDGSITLEKYKEVIRNKIEEKKTPSWVNILSKYDTNDLRIDIQGLRNNHIITRTEYIVSLTDRTSHQIDGLSDVKWECLGAHIDSISGSEIRLMVESPGIVNIICLLPDGRTLERDIEAKNKFSHKDVPANYKSQADELNRFHGKM